MNEQDLRQYARRAADFVATAHTIFHEHEDAAQARVAKLSSSYELLEGLNIDQDDFFRQSLRCAEHGLYRAGHVMAWVGVMDFLEDRLDEHGIEHVHAIRPAWKGGSIETMREYVSEYQLIDVLQPLGICTKNQVKALHGLLHRRNECAHPSGYHPGINETLGFISESIARVRQLSSHLL